MRRRAGRWSARRRGLEIKSCAAGRLRIFGLRGSAGRCPPASGLRLVYRVGVQDDRSALLAALAESLRELRERAGRPSISSLRRATGFSEATVCDALSGRLRPSRRVVTALAAALGADPDTWQSRWDTLDRAQQSVPGARWRRAPDQPAGCLVEGCPNESSGRLCSTHRRHERLYGDPTAGPFNATSHSPTCSVDGCDRPYSAKGLCRPHYVGRQRASAAQRSLEDSSGQG